MATAELAGDVPRGIGAARSDGSVLARAGRWVWSTRPFTIAVLSLLSGLVASSLVLVLSIEELRHSWGSFFSHPLGTLDDTRAFLWNAYGGLLRGAVGSPSTWADAVRNPSTESWATAARPLGNTITSSVPLVIGGLGLSVAYRSGVFNIGGRSQLVGGAVLASWAGFSFPSMPAIVHVPMALAAGIVGGALMGLLPGLLKAWTGASEVIVTIMMNYVAANLLVYLLTSTFFQNSRAGSTAPTGRITLPSARLPMLFGDRVGINLGLIVAIVSVIVVAVFLTRSRLGFELQMAGASRDAARVAGLSQARVYVVALVLSGGIVGLAGAVQVLGTTGQLQSTFGGELGALVLVVALVGRSSPTGVVFAGVLYGALQAGGLTMQLEAGVSYQLVGVFQALIVLFVTAPALVAAIYRLRQGGPSSEMFTTSMSAGWSA